MPAVTYEIDVVLDDGTEHRVTGDQRDVASWEAQPFGTPSTELRSKFVVFQRYIAWSALRRHKLIPDGLAWGTFNRDTCVQALLVTGGDDEAAPDPGLPDRSDVS